MQFLKLIAIYTIIYICDFYLSQNKEYYVFFVNVYILFSKSKNITKFEDQIRNNKLKNR